VYRMRESELFLCLVYVCFHSVCFCTLGMCLGLRVREYICVYVCACECPDSCSLAHN